MCGVYFDGAPGEFKQAAVMVFRAGMSQTRIRELYVTYCFSGIVVANLIIYSVRLLSLCGDVL